MKVIGSYRRLNGAQLAFLESHDVGNVNHKTVEQVVRRFKEEFPSTTVSGGVVQTVLRGGKKGNGRHGPPKPGCKRRTRRALRV